MSPYLSLDALKELRGAAIAAGYGDPNMRPLLLNGVLPMYVSTLPNLAAPAAQLQSDLNRMNNVDRLVDGSVPLEIWLRNAVSLTAEAAPTAVFERALDKVASTASGEPEPPSEAELGELKEQIVHHDDTVPFEFLQLGREAGAAVARLRVPPFMGGQRRMVGDQPSPPHLGTAWLLTAELLVTNHHVVAARAKTEIGQLADDDLRLQGRSATAQFDYDREEVEVPAVECSDLVAWDRELDYAVLRLAQPSGRRPLAPARERPAVDQGERVPVNIIQHPMGEPKRVGLRNNLVTASTTRDLRYFTDTRKGSSGSPVLDDDWKVVALHRGSRRVEGVTFQGKDTAYVNVGTQIQAILADLAERFPVVREEVTAVNGG